jgi:hypothetical protein
VASPLTNRRAPSYIRNRVDMGNVVHCRICRGFSLAANRVRRAPRHVRPSSPIAETMERESADLQELLRALDGLELSTLLTPTLLTKT